MRYRPTWTEYFLQIAKDVASRATCLRRCYGAVIVDEENVIISTGYCGAPRGEINCTAIGTCKRKELNIPSGERYELCRSVHAEQNAIINGDPKRMANGTIYLAGFDSETGETVNAHPCMLCARMIKNARIAKVVYLNEKMEIVIMPSSQMYLN